MNTSSSKTSKHQTDEFYIYERKTLKEKKIQSKCFSKYNNNYIKCHFKRRTFQYNLCLQFQCSINWYIIILII